MPDIIRTYKVVILLLKHQHIGRCTLRFTWKPTLDDVTQRLVEGLTPKFKDHPEAADQFVFEAQTFLAGHGLPEFTEDFDSADHYVSNLGRISVRRGKMYFDPDRLEHL